MGTLTVRGLTLGEGLPKICVPITAPDLPGVLAQGAEIARHRGNGADLCEWRVDGFTGLSEPEAVQAACSALRETLGEMPLLLTLRTCQEGGEAEVKEDDYLALVERLTALQPDLVDIELFTAGASAKVLVESAHRLGVKVVLSSHDFSKTPPEAEIIRRLSEMDQLGGDLCKIAVMPRCREDVMALLTASVKQSARSRAPLITMSMGAMGAVSRICGSLTGSAVTFATLGTASAPGQLPAEKVAEILPLLRL